jgi:GntR family transcriptional regulator
MKNPVYMIIVEDIREKINSGKLKPGDDIPSETALCNEYDTSRMTVRKGLAILANDGYIFSIPGKGYYVKKPEYNKYTLYYDEMNNLINSVNQTKLLGVEIVMPSDELSQSLQISKKKKVIMIRRLFYTDGEPMAYDVKYLIYQKGMPIVEKEIKEATFPEMISKNTSLFAMKKELMIYARYPEEKTKKLLNMYSDLALMVVEQKLFDSTDKPMGQGITYFRGDYIKLKGVSQ